MSKRVSSPEKQLRDGIEGIVRKEIDNLTEVEGQIPLSPGEIDFSDEGFLDKQTAEDAAALERLLAGFPSSEGFYGKLYRRNPNGKLEYKFYVDHLEEMDDPELEIANLVKEKRWKGGEYLIRIMKRGQPNVQKSFLWNIDQDEIGIAPSGSTESVSDKIQDVKDTVTAVKDLLGGGRENPDIHKQMGESFKLGADLVKGMMPEKSDNQMLTMVSLFKELGLIKKDSSDDTIMKIVTIMKEMYAPKPQDDIWASLIKMKELGVIKFAGEQKDDTMEMVEKIRTLTELAGSLGGGGSNDKSSVTLRLVEILAPQFPRIIENITGTINQVAEVAKLKLSRHLGTPVIPTPPGVPIPPEVKKLAPTFHSPYETGEIPPPEPDEVTPGVYPAPNPETIVRRNPIIQQIFNAVKINNTEFYPQMKELIMIYIGPHALDLLINKQVSVETFLHQLSTTFNEEFLMEDDAKLYLNNFVEWYKMETVKGITVAVCNTCKSEFEYDSPELFEADNKNCECGGTLGLKHTEPSAPIGNA